MTLKQLIEQAKASAAAGIALTREQIIRLLEIPLDSEEDRLLRQAAHEIAMARTGGRAYIWSAVGADYAPCPMNCKFCSFGEAWGIVRQPVHYSPEQIIARAAEFVRGGARFIVLRTTEFYSIPVLLELVAQLRREVPGDYEIIFNTGEFDLETAKHMHASGVSGIYHACRLREGTDTPFDPALRQRTMDSVCRSDLKLISLVEPVGPEHTNEELADNFLRILHYGAVISGAMARIPVPGTPLGQTRQLSDHRLAQIIAVLRLSGGGTVEDICVHTASAEALASGANVVVVETGAVPRDADCSSDNWHQFDMAAANQLLQQAGYTVWNHG